MERGVNKVILVGNLGNNPDVRYSADGRAIANVSLATTYSWKDKNSGEQQDRTEWHRVVFFNRLAEIVSEYLKKGAQVYVEGRLQTSKWQDQSGTDRYTTEIVASEMQMLGGRSGGGTADYGEASSGGGQQQRPAVKQAAAPRGNSAPAPAPPMMDDLDDDIPF